MTTNTVKHTPDGKKVCPDCDGQKLMHGYDADCPTCEATGFVTIIREWQPISTAPKDATLILYANRFGEIGFCYWSAAGGPFDESMWWDDHHDDEVYPKWWLPAETLPALPPAPQEKGGE